VVRASGASLGDPGRIDTVTDRVDRAGAVAVRNHPRAAQDLTDAGRDGALAIKIGSPLPLDKVAEAHERVDRGSRERVLVDLGD
jgi:NADPH2:quinone reductase